MKKVLFAFALFASLSSFAQKKEEPKPESKIEQPKPQLTDSTMIQVVMKYSVFSNGTNWTCH